MLQQMHPRIKELRKKALPVTFGGMQMRADGSLSDNEMTLEDKTIKGYAAVWNIPDSYGTYFVRGSFAKSIQERGPDSNSKYKITFLWQHEIWNPIGRVTVLREDEYGLYFEAVLDADMNVEDADRALQQIRSGTLNQFSFGFNYIWDKVSYNEMLDLIEVREVELMEISVVTIGSQTETYAIRSSKNNDDAIIELNIKTEQFIKSLPRAQQLELRQLIADQIALRAVEPLNKSTLPGNKPLAEIDYSYLCQNLKL
jgi:uncharacterized protein